MVHFHYTLLVLFRVKSCAVVVAALLLKLCSEYAVQSTPAARMASCSFATRRGRVRGLLSWKRKKGPGPGPQMDMYAGTAGRIERNWFRGMLVCWRTSYPWYLPWKVLASGPPFWLLDRLPEGCRSWVTTARMMASRVAWFSWTSLGETETLTCPHISRLFRTI